MAALWLGLLSAASLPLGAVLGVLWKPPQKVVAVIMAFGAGSLLAALMLELILPSFQESGFWPVAMGATSGGLLFVVFNYLLNSQGAFLRKRSTTSTHILHEKKEHLKGMIELLSKVDIFQALTPEEINLLLPHIKYRKYEPGAVIFNQGDAGNSLYLIERGEVKVIQNGDITATLGAGSSFGEMALLSGEPRNAMLAAVSPVNVWYIDKDDFDRLVKVSPMLLDAVRRLSETRIRGAQEVERWRRQVLRHVNEMSFLVTEHDVQEAGASHAMKAGAAMAIFLGAVLDGIPEAGVVGASLLKSTEQISWTLIIGLFLANFPESLSSAVGMKAQKISSYKIIGMWVGLTLVMGLCAVLGYVFLAGVSPATFALCDGVAAGAILVMVAETMLPEAYEQGGTVVGLSTLLGFLTGLLIKSLG
jgi:CRP-like cAMP-binding protein